MARLKRAPTPWKLAGGGRLPSLPNDAGTQPMLLLLLLYLDLFCSLLRRSALPSHGIHPHLCRRGEHGGGVSSSWIFFEALFERSSGNRVVARPRAQGASL